MITTEQNGSSAGTAMNGIATLKMEFGQLPFPLLLDTLDEPNIGVLIFDTQLRLLHTAGQISYLIGLPLEEPIHSLSVGQLLETSDLDRSSIELAKSRVAEFTGVTSVAPALLHSRDRSRHVRMKLRSIGQEQRVALFETITAEELASFRFGLNEPEGHDSLTGLASKSYFENAVKEVLARTPHEPVSVLMLDLDRFKAVNDTLGHAVGDSVLRLAAERLKSSVRKTDIVARLGGDEFAILVHPSPSMDEPVAIAQRVLDLVQRTYLIEGQLVNIGVSIGIARSPGDGEQYARLLRNADLALYHSKNSGRSSFHFFDAHMERRAQARRTNEIELRRALALRQLEVHYQPQVSTVIGRLVGFEALLRWRHPERGMIPPGDFLPMAEEIGLIVPIGDWVLRTACREATQWPEDIIIAVNASPLQFDAGNFADSVQRALSVTGLPGERLEIEITEGILLRNDGAVLETLHRIREMNVRIAMDDFGTGYASLSQLARFPFDKIKIDRSLAGFEGNDAKQRAIVRAITALGQSLGVCTLAEGVESADQLARLQVDGCTSVQGYFFGKAAPAAELKNIISQLYVPSLT